MAAPTKAKVDFDPLTKDNYQLWINHVRDYLLEVGALNFYDASEQRGDEAKDKGDADDYAEPNLKNDKGRTAWPTSEGTCQKIFIRKHYKLNLAMLPSC